MSNKFKSTPNGGEKYWFTMVQSNKSPPKNKSKSTVWTREPKLFSQNVGETHGDESHGRIRKKISHPKKTHPRSEIMNQKGFMIFPKAILIGGWTNPFEKYARQIGWFPQGSGWQFQKYLSCHHPVIHQLILNLHLACGFNSSEACQSVRFII